MWSDCHGESLVNVFGRGFITMPALAQHCHFVTAVA